MRSPLQWFREQVEAAEPGIVDGPAGLDPGRDGPDPDGEPTCSAPTAAAVVAVDGDVMVVAEPQPDGTVLIHDVHDVHRVAAVPTGPTPAPFYQVQPGDLDATETLKAANQRLRRQLADAEARARRFEVLYRARASERDRWRTEATGLSIKLAAATHPPTLFIAREQDGPEGWFELGKLAGPISFTDTNGSTTSGGRTEAGGPGGERAALGALPGQGGAEGLAAGPVPGEPARLEHGGAAPGPEPADPRRGFRARLVGQRGRKPHGAG